MLDLNQFISTFERNAGVIAGLVGGVSEKQARWKPTPEAWSILEVVNHLYDEEREDFRVRVDYTLHKPGEKFPGIDPEGWVTERGYNTRDLRESLDRFMSERKKSLEWLAGLESPDWNTAYAHEMAGRRFHAGDFLASWLAHDYLHMRQFARLHFESGKILSEPYSTDYAGSW